MPATRISLTEACERVGCRYHWLRDQYLAGIVTGGRNEKGKIEIDPDSLDELVIERARRAGIEVDHTPALMRAG
jgi:hypothetical protein